MGVDTFNNYENMLRTKGKDKFNEQNATVKNE